MADANTPDAAPKGADAPLYRCTSVTRHADAADGLQGAVLTRHGLTRGGKPVVVKLTADAGAGLTGFEAGKCYRLTVEPAEAPP